MEEIKRNKASEKSDRIGLSPASRERLDSWLLQVATQLKGINVKRRDLIEYVVLAQPETLSQRQIEEIRKSFFDEIAYARWAVRELTKAKDHGQNITLAELVGATSRPKGTSKPKPAKKFNNELENSASEGDGSESGN